jgi:hypothetical protein
MKSDAIAAQSSRSFAKQVDLNLINMNAVWYDYIARLAEWVYHAVGAGAAVCTSVDYILRVEYQVKGCNIFECRNLLTLLDWYLETPTISKSREKWFITHARNKVFEQHEKLRTEMKK